jgi:hypothetical protein
MSEGFEYAQPVFEHEETDGDCQASIMECPVCGSRVINFVGSSRWTGLSVEITMTCESRHRWEFILAQQDNQMVARCKTYGVGLGLEDRNRDDGDDGDDHGEEWKKGGQ